MVSKINKDVSNPIDYKYIHEYERLRLSTHIKSIVISRKIDLGQDFIKTHILLMICLNIQLIDILISKFKETGTDVG